MNEKVFDIAGRKVDSLAMIKSAETNKIRKDMDKKRGNESRSPILR